MPVHNKTPKKGGNSLTTDLANLSVPFGLILAQKSLEKYLSVQKKPAYTTSSTTKKPVSTSKNSTPTIKKPTTNTSTSAKKPSAKKTSAKK
jgi:hypothetical protein